MEDDKDTKPRTYYDRRNYREDDPFLFISYRHEDDAFVYPDLRQLYQAGLQFWYDDRLEDGENWEERVKSVILKPNCKGVIFYFSENSIESQAIQTEIKCFKDVTEVRKDFILRIISIRGRMPMQMLWDYIHSKKINSESDFINKVPQERLTQFLQFFEEKIIFNPKNTPDDYDFHGRFLEKLKNYGVVVNNESDLDSFVLDRILKKVNDKDYILEFGAYPSNRSESIICPKDNTDFEIEDVRYRSHDMEPYSYGPIEWQMISLDQKVGVFVTEKILDVCSWDDFGRWLGEFKENNLSEEERSMVKEIGLIGTDQMEGWIGNGLHSTKCTEYSKSRFKGERVRVLTGSAFNGTNKRACTGNMNNILPVGISSNCPAGVRLYAVIDFSSRRE